MDVYGTELEPAEAVLYWSYGDKQFFIYPLDWPNAKELLKRVLRRITRSNAAWVNLQSSLGKISTTGQPAETRLGDHTVGLVRPWLAGPLPESFKGAPEPVMLSRPETPPILFADIEDGRGFVRRVRDEHGLRAKEWSPYRGEFEPSDAEMMYVKLTTGTVLRTRLEEELGKVLYRRQGPSRRRSAVAS